jgi:hypothetical protein
MNNNVAEDKNTLLIGVLKHMTNKVAEDKKTPLSLGVKYPQTCG